MKKMKKVLAMIMALAMVFGMGLTTMAAETSSGVDGIIGTDDDTGTLEVTGIVDEEDANITVTAYQIVDADYEAQGETFSGYHNVYDLGIQDLKSPTRSELYTLYDTITKKGAASGYLGEVIDHYDVEEGIRTYSEAGFDVGTYLIVVSGSEATTYSLAVASIKYVVTNAGGSDEWGMESPGLDLAAEAAYVKRTTGPTVEKEVANGSTDTPDTNTTADIGDILTYTVTIAPVPDYDGDYPVLNITDTISAGLKFVSTEENVQVTATTEGGSTADTLIKDTDYTIDIRQNSVSQLWELYIDFAANNNYTLTDDDGGTDYTGGTITVTYQVVVTEDAAHNQNANTNDVELEYSKDSNINDNNDTDTDTTYTYTFDIDGAVMGSLTEGIITKYGEEKNPDTQENLPLEGAIFQLYTNYNPETNAVSDPYTRDKDSEKGITAWDGKVTSDEDGQLKMYGLEGNKTYYLKEIQAPVGYSLNDTVYSINIQMSNDLTTGELTNYTITVKDVEAEGTGNVNSITYNHESEEWEINKAETDIQNTSIASLPSTGGIGTTIFTVGGCVIMIAAAALFFMNRRKSEE